ncbi:MAG: aminotransferase class I/II-fold pyridoxal phosphate-dependent enzyme [Bacteroidales bacterium]|jgi:methionine aminotransferase|nr:aminotransferase class I/II-fold pyridoxal phosphate-dependent enzyme [Bacteroidales bacterium]MDD4384181.1 aminotransferase class I/II-fold pyridoxal phosphate-dependent enzyme [Bacteroidales bacterium]MDY0197807.1 aminotransferase class I/II-fold pyridoxal phosphate-dependent enzyme [Tenuifilaceae bacterium]
MSKLSSTNLVATFAQIAAEKNAVNLSNDHTDFPCQPELLDSLVKHISDGRNKYAPSEGVYGLRQVIANRYKADFDISFNPETEITITAGAIQAIYTAISSLIKEGDEVILFEPAFETYIPAIEARGARPIFFQLNPTDFSVDWTAFTKLITSKTKLIILNCPHNPSGKIMPDESLEQLQRILNGTKISILSDEAFADLVYDERPVFSIARYPKLAERSIIVGSLGKALCVPGWKIGYCLAPDSVMESFRQVHKYLISSVNLPIQLALADYLGSHQCWSPFRSEFQHRRDYLSSLLAKTRFTFERVEGGYFQILNYKNISTENDIDFCYRLATEHGVTAYPLSPFYHDKLDQSMIRVCFGKGEEDLRLAAKRLAEL